MKKKFNILIPRSVEESFNLLCKSGNDITSWKTNISDLKNGYIEWKQSFMSLTGTSIITATLEQIKENETSVSDST